MIVEGHPDLEHWGRRLMASALENETEPKNCSEPGKHSFTKYVPSITSPVSLEEGKTF